MEKKITLTEFWNSEEKLCIHCDTEEKANTLLKAFDILGKTWAPPHSIFYSDIIIPYTKCSFWANFKNETVYYNEGTFGRVKNAKKNGYTIYEFDEVDLGN